MRLTTLPALLLAHLGLLTGVLLPATAHADTPLTEALSTNAQAEMRALLADKYAVTGDERKLDPGLRFALQRVQQRGIARQLPQLRVLAPDPRGRFHIDVLLHSADHGDKVQALIRALPEANLQSAVGTELRAWVRAEDITTIAALTEVRRVQRAIPAITSRSMPTQTTALNIGEGVRAHAVDLARAAYGLRGLGQKICVMSDSIDFLGAVQSSGDLPAAIEILPGQSGLGMGFIGEGTAMLEIVHDLAPDAELAFATAFTGVASFAQNVRALRYQAGCDVIVDDIFYFNEPPFQDGPIAQAVAEVSADGALYFSSAGNEGNLRNGMSGVYEGNFVDGGTLAALPGGNVNLFSVPGVGSSNQVRALAPGFAASLSWSDPLGASANDYDVFVMSPDLQHVLDAGLDLQDGDDDPFELTGPLQTDDRLVVWKATAAAPRFLHLNGLRGRFNLATGGQTKGHSAAAAAFSVAAVDSHLANGGAFVGGSGNPVESFSSDGPRRMYYSADGDLLNPDQPSLLADGGSVRIKPDVAAADGVVTATPGFSQFYGTSAAAPHVAAIAALLRQARPDASPTEIRTALNASALDIETAGIDALSGVGIVMADGALAAIGATPVARLRQGSLQLQVIDGDADAIVEPGETFDVSITLHNDGAATASAITATLETSTSSVQIIRASTAWPDLAPTMMATATLPFRIHVAPTHRCGEAIELKLHAHYSGASIGTSPQALGTHTLPVGALDAAITTQYSGAAQSIPDNDAAGIAVGLAVTAGSARIGDIDVRIDGNNCSDELFSTTTGVQHGFIGDLDIRLRSPAGTEVRLLDRPRAGVGDNNGNHLCQTVFDDAAISALADAAATAAPFSASYRGSEALSAFNGELASGTWQLLLADHAAPDAGVLRDFSVVIQPAQCTIHTPVLLHSDGFE